MALLPDDYEPVPPPVCPTCGETMTLCQGEPEGGGAALVWRQRERRPLRQKADEPFRGAELDRFTLPDVFWFSCWCPQGHWSDYRGECEDGLWVRTVAESD